MGAIQQVLSAIGDTGGGAAFDTGQVGGSAPTFSNGNLTITGPASSQASVRTTTSKSSGKHYFEMRCTGPANNLIHKVGVIQSGTIPTELGGSANSYSYYRANAFDGSYYHNGSPSGSPPTIPANGIVMVAIDIDAGKLWFGVDGTFQGDPAAGTGAAFTGVTGDVWPAGGVSVDAVITYRPNAASQTYSPPGGFSAWS